MNLMYLCILFINFIYIIFANIFIIYYYFARFITSIFIDKIKILEEKNLFCSINIKQQLYINKKLLDQIQFFRLQDEVLVNYLTHFIL